MNANLPPVFSSFKFITALPMGFNHFKDKNIILIIVKTDKETKRY